MGRMLRQGRSFSGRERNCLFLNTGLNTGNDTRKGLSKGAGYTPDKGRFATISAVSGLDFLDDGRAVALVDWDHDGDVDLWTSNRNAPRLRFLRNDTPCGNHFLALRLVGNGTSSPRDAIGARVEVVTARAKRLKTLRAGEGFLAQSSKWLHFGLGQDDRVEAVTVRWPDGALEKFTGLELDRRYVLRQGPREGVSGTFEEWKRSSPAKVLTARAPELPPQAGAARIPLIPLLTMPKLTYRTLDTSSPDAALRGLPVGQEEGKAVLINLWASWCVPCLRELKEFTEREADIRAAGIDVVALSVDALNDERSDPQRARELLSKLEFPFTAGFATAELVAILQRLHDNLIPLRRPLPVPTSFLVDRSGRLQVIYKGRLVLNQLLEDASHSQKTRSERMERAALRPGSVIEHEEVARAADHSEVKVRYAFAMDMQMGGRSEDAIVQYRELLELEPEFGDAHGNLAGALLERGDTEAAGRHCETALRLDLSNAEAHCNLGRILEARGEPARAAAEFRRALSLRADFPLARESLGLLYFRHGKTEEAALQFERLLESRPDDASALNMLGVISQRQGRVEEALERFRGAVRADPQDANAHSNLGRALLARGDDEAAEGHYRTAVRLDPTNTTALFNLGMLFEKRQELGEAAAWFERALRTRPDFLRAHYRLAVVRARQGKLQEAEAQLERVLELQPDHADARSNLEKLRALIQKQAKE
jgi:Flp pilus assembly protein TadD/thiol-disulfide isomerase/thioredoxin